MCIKRQCLGKEGHPVQSKQGAGKEGHPVQSKQGAGKRQKGMGLGGKRLELIYAPQGFQTETGPCMKSGLIALAITMTTGYNINHCTLQPF